MVLEIRYSLGHEIGQVSMPLTSHKYKVSDVKEFFSKKFDVNVSRCRVVCRGVVLKISDHELGSDDFVYVSIMPSAPAPKATTTTPISNAQPVQPAPPQPVQPETQPQLPLNLPVDEESLEFIVSMGYSDAAARKALFLCHNDIDEAVAWIIERMDSDGSNDDELETPVTQAEFLRVMMETFAAGNANGDGTVPNVPGQTQGLPLPDGNQNVFAGLNLNLGLNMNANANNQQGPGQGNAQPGQSNVTQSQLAECVESGTCTYKLTGSNFATQQWYYCKTCSPENHVGVCKACAATCHAGHDLQPGNAGQFFCDCGEGSLPAPCKCMK